MHPFLRHEISHVVVPDIDVELYRVVEVSSIITLGLPAYLPACHKNRLPFVHSSC